MKKVNWEIEGMTCGNCALTISKYLDKEGMKDVKVNPISGDVSFTKENEDDSRIITGIEALGYKVAGVSKNKKSFSILNTNKKRFLFCLPFTLVLMMHMLDGWIHLHWLMDPWVQFAICLPVFLIGMWFFGRSAINSLRNGMPNMTVLIATGAVASFAYSVTGAVLGLGENYFFFETTASIITLVFMGNYLEDASVQSTQRAIRSLVKSQKVMANMIAFDDQHKEQIFPLENTQLKVGDLVLIRTGEQVPLDCKILWGDCMVDEAILTGESIPLSKGKKDVLIGGSILVDGIVKAQVTATGSDTVLSGILRMVQDAQGEKPPVQLLADRISAIFVPVVLVIAVATFIINFAFFDITAGPSLMRSVAVLVIACPCAMGLATPAAIAVGLGRAARSGILFRNAAGLELFDSIKQVVFDKTGTLTTGKFVISAFESDRNENDFKRIVYSLEKFSSHPLARSIAEAWKTNDQIKWKNISEVKGKGVRAEDQEGNIYEAGSFSLQGASKEDKHTVHITINGKQAGWIDMQDEVREEAITVIKWLHAKNIRTILLSGDTFEKSNNIAAKLGITEVIAEQTPDQKLAKITELTKAAPTVMVGDGINDAPALAKATIGISLSEASLLAIQPADIILLSSGLKKLPQALGLGKHTYITIRQNLFWAFLYNIVAIPVAAIGLLTPTVAALAMGLSDVVLAINSVRLFVKKVI